MSYLCTLWGRSCSSFSSSSTCTRSPGDTAKLGVTPWRCVPFQSAPAFPSCFRLSLEHTLTRVPPGAALGPNQAKSSQAKSRLLKKRRSQPESQGARMLESQKADLLQRPFWPFETRSDVCVYIQFCMLHIQYLCNLPFGPCPLPLLHCAAGASFSLFVGVDVFIWVLFRFVSFRLRTLSLANSICLLTFATCTLADFILAGPKDVCD